MCFDSSRHLPNPFAMIWPLNIFLQPARISNSCPPFLVTKNICVSGLRISGPGWPYLRKEKSYRRSAGSTITQFFRAFNFFKN